MAEQICDECGATYDPDTVNVPTPVPDFMCANCGTQYTQEEIAALQPPYAPPSD